jgi:hypothetical protein
MGKLEILSLTFFAQSPRNVVELLLLCILMPLSELLAIANFSDASGIFAILVISGTFVIGPFLEELAFLF